MVARSTNAMLFSIVATPYFSRYLEVTRNRFSWRVVCRASAVQQPCVAREIAIGVTRSLENHPRDPCEHHRYPNVLL